MDTERIDSVEIRDVPQQQIKQTCGQDLAAVQGENCSIEAERMADLLLTLSN